jgi:endo-1,4-beta-D-glucanase Y
VSRNTIIVLIYRRHKFLETISACYSWEMALNVGLNASFDNVWDWTVYGRKQGKLIVRK